MIKEQRLDLHLPTSWAACTTQELEIIAEVLVRHMAQASPLHPFDMYAVKAELFFRLAGIEIVEQLNPVVNVESQYYVCRCPKQKTDNFQLYLWQIDAWIGKGEVTLQDGKVIKKDNLLGWLDGNDGTTIPIFPYPMITRKKNFWSRKKFKGPEPLMDGFTWQRYRFAQDLFEYHTNVSNQLLDMQHHRIDHTDEEIKKMESNVDSAKAMFLATIFNGKITTVDEQTKKIVKSYAYHSNQSTDNQMYFRNWSPVQWQVILFWWNGMMEYLKKKFPHMFKKGDVAENQATNPMEVYTRTTATLEKYLNLNEDEVNRQFYTVVLQHIDDMIKENEEMKRIKAKS